MIFFALLHWLLSQAIFLVRVDFYDDSDTMNTGGSISTCGFSNIAIIGAIFVGSLGVIAISANGFRRFSPGIPSAVGCSAVISAACHRPAQDESASLGWVKWGAVKTRIHTGEDGEEPFGHCCITSLKVEEPVEGGLYA
jgi:hypothetical protein